MTKEFVHLHVHTDISNISSMEVVTKADDYIKWIKEQNGSALAVTDHGLTFNWITQKIKANEAGLKYIFGIEAYVTDTLEEKVRDNFHLILLARNYEGVKEINRMSSNAFNRQDNHYYYKPRMSFDEIAKTSDNIIILTACLGSPLYQHYKNGNKDSLKKWMNFFVKNKHRVYLEVQPHNDREQIYYNKFLLKMADKYKMNIVATNDVHALNKEHDRLRKIMKRSKGIEYESDDDLDLTIKTRKEMFDLFKKQGVLSDDEIENALDNTSVIKDSISDFDFDRSIKYPKLHENPEKEFQRRIKIGLKERGIDKLPKDVQKQYAERVNLEYKVFKKLGAINFMLLEREVRDFTENESIYPGPSRGSSSGSLIAYLMKITQMDSIKHNLNFSRFMNENRVSIGDIDEDYYSRDRERVQRFLLEHEKLDTASIGALSTIALKGAIKDIGRGMGYDNSVTDFITKQIEKDDYIPAEIEQNYKELIDNAKSVMGITVALTKHPAGVCCADRKLSEELGLVTVGNFDYPITAVTMKEIDYLNYVKLDILGLDNVGLINITAQLAGLPRLTPDSTDIIDFEDMNVWRSMVESNIGVFQFEGNRAGKLLRDFFSPNVIQKIKSQNQNIKMMDMLSLLNAGQRPGSASILDELLLGNFHDNGHPALNDMLTNSMGYLIYQESLTEFLVKMCGWSESEADLIRRGIGKKSKEIMDNEVPKIKPSFIKTMIEKYGDTQEHAEEIADAFVQIFLDAANYGFSINHSTAYSYIGYICTWLRYYYPVEFCTAGLMVWNGDEEKTVKLLNYAEEKGITLSQPKFRYSRGDYYMDVESKTIYQGTSPIKGANMQSGDDLYSLREHKFENWIDFLLHIKDGSTIEINNKTYTMYDLYTTFTEDEIKALDKEFKADPGKFKVVSNPFSSLDKRNLEPLIRLNYFEEFGNPNELWQTYELFNSKYKPKNKTFAGKFKNFNIVKDFFDNNTIENFKAAELLEMELYYTGRVTQKFDVPAKYAFVTNVVEKKTRTTAQVFSIKHGKMIEVKVGSKLYKNVPFKEGDIIEIRKGEYKPKNELIAGKWVKSATKKEYWLNSLVSVHKSKIFGKK